MTPFDLPTLNSIAASAAPGVEIILRRNSLGGGGEQIGFRGWDVVMIAGAEVKGRATRVCRNCGHSFEGRADAVACSGSCRKAIWRKRQREEKE